MAITELSMERRRVILLVCAALIGLCNARMDECYLTDGRSQRCLPPFVNAAFGKTVQASNTCGMPAEQYCLQTGVTGVTTSCHICDSEDPSRRHDATFLTDFNNEDLSTWWQSSTMLHDVQFPNMVNLTLNLNKAFDITYVRLRFHTSRPESFAIYKKSCDDCDWQAFQFYSGSCFATFDIDNKEIVTVDNEQKPLCTDDFSDISPLTGGNVAFSTLESRPSAYNFDKSPVLQDWVKAVAIRISLNRINTFGDEVFRDPKVLKSYYYAISDLSIGGRCSCNGHASECYVTANDVLQCRCKHNTAGRDCEICADMFNDRPWARATGDDPGECQACDCNGMSDSCYFDPELYRQTGHGGHCTECRDNTDGPHCEYCRPYHYRDPVTERCSTCECSEIGSNSQQCNTDGQCSCKPGVGGARCDHCLEGYYGLSEAGCSECRCNEAGTVEGSICNAETGACVCKLNVEGMNCDTCKVGTMNLQASNPYGCTACFCFGHSSVCEVSDSYTVAYILSEFAFDSDYWHGRDNYNNPAAVAFTGNGISMQPAMYYMSYFVAPDKFLGMQRNSYNQMLEFELFTEQLPDAELDVGSGADANNVAVAIPSREDIILEGGGFRVVASITSQGNPVPNDTPQLYRFRLHEASEFTPRLEPLEFQTMLNSLENINIRSTYGDGLAGHLDNVQLTTAEREGAGPPADWVEECDVAGYQGDNADFCAPGYTRDPPNGGPFADCVPCNCNGHSDVCDRQTGVCECEHNTMGDHCELCDDGFYFSGDESRRGTPQECQPCPCPERSACAVTDDGSVVCTSCPPGHAGKQCEICMDGWFGDPRGRGPCLRCMCNGNIDENNIMNCNRTTGECLKCIHNTTGFHCEDCLPGYYGRPVTNNPEERCRLCECNHMGSRHSSMCNAATGRCDCLPNVEGRACDQCRSTFWNIESGDGCEACNCHSIGSSTGECDEDSGQCVCLPGVGGQRCDRCLPNHYGLSREGCTACDCNLDGSLSLQCDDNGKCECNEGVYGIKCDKCQENYFDLANGCRECPACYGLVQDAVAAHRDELDDIEKMMANIGDSPPQDDPMSDVGFQEELEALNSTVNELAQQGKNYQDQQDRLNDQVDQVTDVLEGLIMQLAGIEGNVDQCNSTVQQAAEKNTASKGDTDAIRSSLQVANAKLTQAMADLNAAHVIADDSLGKEDNMSRIAQEAEALAIRHQDAAQDIVDTAQNAYDTSRMAQDSIQEAIVILENLMSTLEDMIVSDNKIPAARTLRDVLLTQATVVRDNAEAAKNESTDLFTEAGKLTVPMVDTDDMDTRSQNIINEANALMPRIDQLDDDFKNNYGNLEGDIAKANGLLQLADAAQDTADLLLARVFAAQQEALDAVRSGNDTYQSVLDTKKSLESFDEAISVNRDDATEAIGRVDEIQAQIDLANNKTSQAQAALGTARSIATQASNKAQQALDIADNIQSSAQNILSDATDSHGRASDIGADVGSLSDDLADTENLISAAEGEADSDGLDVAAATAAASGARAAAAESSRRVNNVLQQLQDLRDRLSNMADVDDQEISEMEAEYERLRALFEAANIPAKIEALTAEANKQSRTLRTYDAEIAALRADVENLRQIYAAIPLGCSDESPVEEP